MRLSFQLGWLWPTLRTKICHSHLSAFMVLKLYRGLRFGAHLYIWYLDPYKFSSLWGIFCSLANKTNWRGQLVELSNIVKFIGLSCICFEISIYLKLDIRNVTHRVRVSSQSGHSDLLYCEKWVKVIFRHVCPQKIYRAFTFGTRTYKASLVNCTAFRHGWAIFGPLVATNTREWG